MKTRLRKLVAVALVLAMLLTVMPASVFAAPEGADVEEPVPSTPAEIQEEPAPAEEPAPVEKPAPTEEPEPVEEPESVEEPAPAEEPAPVEEPAPTEEPEPAPVEITVQPEDVSAVYGSKAVFTVEAVGDGLSYRWQYTTKKGMTWYNVTSATAGYNKDTLKVAVNASSSGYQYRCVVTDEYGNTAVSEPAKLIGEKAEITAQPEDVAAARYSTAVFTVATNAPVKSYLWQYMSVKKWYNLNSATQGYNKDTLKVVAASGRNGYQYRCIITLADGTKITSDAAKLSVVQYPVIKKDLKVDDKLTVSVDAEEGAFPQGTVVNAEKVELVDVQKAVDEAEDVSGTVLYAVDITFTKDGEELQPAEGKSVKVSFSAPELKDKAEDATVVHINSETKKAEPVETVDNEEEDAIVFNAKRFSIYALVEPGQDGDEARVKLNFYGYKQVGATYVPDSNPIATVYVKNADDTLVKLEQVLADPGVGKIGGNLLFNGWSMDDRKDHNGVVYTDTAALVGEEYTTETTLRTIEGIRQYLLDNVIGNIKEGDVIDVYAGVFKYYNVTYYGTTLKGDPIWDVSLGTVTALLRPDENEAAFKVVMPYSTADNQNFKGWVPTAEEVTLEDITIPATAGNIHPTMDYYPNNEEVTLTGDVVFTVDAPQGAWLIYHSNGGPFNAPEFYLGNENTVQPASATEQYMKRNGYSFQGWYTDPSFTTEFQFGGLITENTHIYAKWSANTRAPYTVIFWTQNLDRTGYDMAGSAIREDGVVGQPIPYDVVDHNEEDYVSGFGNQGRYTGFCLKDADKNQQVEITPEGDAVLNLHYDRIVYNFRFYYYRERNGNNPYSYANASANYTGNGVYGVAAWSNWGNSHPEQTYGADQTAEVENYTAHYFVLSAYYGENIASRWPSYSQIQGPSEGRADSPVSFVMMNGTGLKKKVNTAGTGIGRGSDTIKGLITVMDEMILGDTSSANGNFVVVRFANYYDWNYHIWYEVVNNQIPAGAATHEYNGKTYYEAQTLTVRSSNVNLDEQNPPQYQGYEYLTSRNEDWSGDARWTEGTGDPRLNVTYHVNYIYNRMAYPIAYMDGVYVDGSAGGGVLIESRAEQLLNKTEDIEQGTTIADEYVNYVPQPVKEGFVFEGWYMDEGCTTEYEWTTMPVGGITVHAKWRQVQYRVFLHPDAYIYNKVTQQYEKDMSLNWGSDDQQMNFRRAWGEVISLPDGTRDGYEFLGWYKADGGFFTADTEMNDTTVPATPVYDKTTDFTDTMDIWGEVTNPRNSDTDRPWITRKLDLYGHWRQVIEGAEGINVEYVVGDYGKEGTQPTDNLLYTDQAGAIGQSACQVADSYAEEYQFRYWVLQKWVGEYDADGNYDESAHYEDVLNDKGEPVICYPGSAFTVDLNYAYADISAIHLNPATQQLVIDDAVYTVRLRAEYGKKEVETPTHIYFFANNGEKMDDPRQEGSKVPLSVRYYDLQINEEVPIVDGDYFERIDPDTQKHYKFLGWARIDENADGSMGHDPVGNPDGLDASDLWLYWDGENYHEDAIDGRVVNFVAADEKQPYHDLFAVWAPTFTVVYSHDPATEIEIVIEDKDRTYNLKDGEDDDTRLGVDEDYLYGGYYKSMPAAGGSWEWENAYKEAEGADRGTALKPTPFTTYYVKEVAKSMNFLRSIYCDTHKTDGTNRITAFFLLSSIDDLNYKDTGFNFRGQDNSLTGAGTTITVKTSTTGVTKKITRTKFYTPEEGAPDSPDANMTYYRFTTLPKNETLTVMAYWITPDGVREEGTMQRVVVIDGVPSVVSSEEKIPGTE